MRKLLDTIILLCISAAFSVSLSAQTPATTVVSGKVTDAVTGEPIVGGSVMVKGKPGVGVITDLDGNYLIEFSGNEKILVYASLGYKDFEQVVTIGKNQKFDIQLSSDVNLLDETVVIGYGSVKKKDLTGAVGSVKGEGIAKINATNVSQALQGSIPGLQVTRTSGLPGASATLRVRGVTTMGDSSPLIILDGVQISSIDYINADDIETVTVLKDAASASIYGARAAAGVILVTSKRAEDGALHVTYNGNFGVVTPTRFPETVSPTRFFEMQNEISWNDGGNVPGQEYSIYSKDLIDNYQAYHNLDPDNYPLTDWKSILVKKWAPSQKHNVSLAYGNKVVRTNASISYEKTDALYDNRSYDVFNVAVNNDIKVAKFLKVFADVRLRSTFNTAPQANPLQGAYLYGPNKAAFWEDGRYGEGHIGNNAPYVLAEGGYVNTQTYMARAKMGFEFEPVKNLVITGVYAPNVQITKKKDYKAQLQYFSPTDPSVALGYINGHESTSLKENRNDVFSVTKQLTANYNVTFAEDHNLSVMAGYEDYSYTHELLGATGDKFALKGFPYLDRAPADQVTVSGSATQLAYMSYFGRIMYDYKHKYLLQANVRRDASSRFHRDSRWGTFPSVSAGWVITEEPWMASTKPYLNFLKFRASYGTLGNERIQVPESQQAGLSDSEKELIRTYPYQSIMNFGDVLMMDGKGGVVSQMTAAQKYYNINNITWETTSTWDIGLDATMFNSRLSLNFDYYSKTTTNMLLNLDIPDLLGYANPSQNAGTMYTNGWELQLGWRDHIGELGYSISANISDYRSVMGNLSGVVFDGHKIIREGSEYNEWYGYVSEGLFLSPSDLATSPKLNNAVEVGDIKFKDISGPDGVPDGKITPEYDRVLLGGSLPRYVYGGTIALDWKGIDFSMTFNGVGKQIVNMSQDMVFHTAAWHTFPSFLDGNYFSYYNTDEQNASARFPRLSQQKSGSTGSYNYENSDFWFIDGSYFRIKNITLGYTFPKAWMQKIHVNNLRVYASVSDPLSIDHFPQGWDPEAAKNAYIARTFNFGVSIKF